MQTDAHTLTHLPGRPLTPSRHPWQLLRVPPTAPHRVIITITDIIATIVPNLSAKPACLPARSISDTLPLICGCLCECPPTLDNSNWPA